MKLTTPNRQNYSRYAKLCDQTFYHDSQPSDRIPPNYELPSQRPQPISIETTAFTSVPRDKRGNYRFSIRLPYGEFSHHPNFYCGRSRSPSWSFSKMEKYQKNKLVEFEVCRKNPLIQSDHQLQLRTSATSMKELLKEQVKKLRSTSELYSKKHNHSLIQRTKQSHEEKEHGSMRETKTSVHNYSIIDARQTSPVGFFTSSKINKPRYLSKEDLKNAQIKLDNSHYQRRLEPTPKGYIEFSLKKPRRPNNNCKNMQVIQYPYQHQKQFNNFSMTAYPTAAPEGHVDMEKHLDRPDYTPNKLGPNTSPFQIDGARVNDRKINVLLSTFRDRVTTRFDRMEPEPNTLLDYDAHPQELGGMVEMNRMIGRKEQLFPIVDPIIKKAGDKEMKEDLKNFRPIIDINEALRPKVVENFTKLVKEGH